MRMKVSARFLKKFITIQDTPVFPEPDAPKRTVIPEFGNSNEHSSLKPSSRGSSREAELKESDIQIRSREN